MKLGFLILNFQLKSPDCWHLLGKPWQGFSPCGLCLGLCAAGWVPASQRLHAGTAAPPPFPPMLPDHHPTAPETAKSLYLFLSFENPSALYCVNPLRIQ